MLYATTRNRLDGYTVQHALTHAVGPDGGGWRPFHDPVFSQEELAALKERSFNGNVAYVLNKLYDCKLTSWDVDFCI
ncbi:MAG: hypothetical protein J6V25_12625, partial [Oscillospiraceae bacterium]|nr:hypothetical protein [Oscillospiraceae bacterium]